MAYTRLALNAGVFATVATGGIFAVALIVGLCMALFYKYATAEYKFVKVKWFKSIYIWFTYLFKIVINDFTIYVSFSQR